MDNFQDFSGDPVVKDPPSNAGDMNLIPDQGTKIPRAAEQLSQCTTTREKPTHHNEGPCMSQQRSHVQLRPNTAN